jgi:hypothetical protein
MVGYVGARGRHMRFQADDVNMVYPNTTNGTPGSNNIQGPFTYPLTWPVPNTDPNPTGPNNTCAGTSPPTPPPCAWPVFNPLMGRTQMAMFDGNYSYNGLQVQLRKAMAHGLQVEGSYTWSKNLDDGGGSVASDPFRNSISTLLWFCKACRRGLTDQDQRHNFTANYEWDIPTPASFKGPAKAIVGNWEAGGVLTIQSGTPFTVLVQGDPLGQNNTDAYQYPDRVAGPGCKNPVNPQNADQYIKLACFTAPSLVNQLGNAGRNSVIGPGLVDMDFSLFKNIPVPRISEAFKAQFRAELFNVFNRPNFTSPNDNRVILNPDNTTATSDNPGAITLTNTNSRQIQFALKFTW